ncbi:MAG TPA: glycosyltransferase family 4 protein [Hyphomicrobium sp.]|nr:glycosyltransferase family 4 protein [Hyphomicrobium sp.]
MAVAPGVLIIVENLTVPLDRRVWQEARTLKEAGYTVSIVCPKGGTYTAPYEVLEGIHIFRHPLPYEADGAVGYALEYSWALAWEFALSVKAYWKVGFEAVQACNPPDLLFLIGGFWKYLFGKRFIFDHHDINPELFEAKFNKQGRFHSLLTWLEKLTFKTADVAIATNETFKEIAIKRGGMSPERVFIVRSVPDLTRFKRVQPNANLKNGRKNLVGYVGIMGAQDGVDLLVDAMDHLVNANGRQDTQCLIVGSGTELPRLEAMVAAKGLQDYVTFTGFLSGEALLSAFSTFDIGVIPDPKNTYNDKISMNKVFEYMTLGIPFVSFDLIECRKASGDAALYAADNDPRDLADKMARLVDDVDLRGALGEEGVSRSRALLKWESERARLLSAYDCALAQPQAGRQVAAVRPASS